jgi:hypothetical protein
MIDVIKIELLIVNHDGLSATEIAETLENEKYPNYCISPKVMSIETREVEWSEDHPLNKRETFVQTYKELFKKEPSEPSMPQVCGS